MEPTEHIWSFGNIIQTILAVSFGLWAWLLKKFGEAHIKNINDLVMEMKNIREELSDLRTELRVVQTRQEMWQKTHDHTERM